MILLNLLVFLVNLLLFLFYLFPFLENNKLGFTAFQKKSEFGPSNIVADKVIMESNVEEFLIEVKSING